jgi:hypothetical protein
MARRPKVTQGSRGQEYTDLFTEELTDEQYNRYESFLVFVKGTIDSDPKAHRLDCIWDIQRDQRGRLRLLVTCPSCIMISDITSHSVHRSGFLNWQDHEAKCVTCPNGECNMGSYWVYLHGWGQVGRGIKKELEEFRKRHPALHG